MEVLPWRWRGSGPGSRRPGAPPMRSHNDHTTDGICPDAQIKGRCHIHWSQSAISVARRERQQLRSTGELGQNFHASGNKSRGMKIPEVVFLIHETSADSDMFWLERESFPS